MRFRDQDGYDDVDGVDPLSVERSGPIQDALALELEGLCLATTPGSLRIDDQADGDGQVVVSLPDGRKIISRGHHVESAEEAAAALEANAALICRARPVILRLLRDRRQWLDTEQVLRDKIQALEVQLEQTYVPVHARASETVEVFPPRPR